jgi:DNA-binding response OmpR family regulator
MNDDAHTILLIEDDPATRTFLADNLAADGYDVVPAETARDGTRLLESRYPDLALVDIGLPDGSGFDVLRRVREADGIASRVDPNTPVVLLSGRATELDRVRGFERGADDFVAKPFSYPELRGRVGALLRRSQRATRGGSASATSRSTRRPGRRASAARSSRSRRRSFLCCARSRPSRPGCTRRRSSCAPCGGTRRPGTRGRSTRTPAGSGRSSASTGEGSSSTSGASGTGLSTGR